MTLIASFIPRNNIDFRSGLTALIFLGLVFILPSPALANQDDYAPSPSLEDSDIHFYNEIYPYRRHWHSEEIPPSQPATEPQAIERTPEENRARDLKQSRFLNKMQEQNRAKALERSRALKEIQARSRAKAQERSLALNKMLKRNKAKALERSRAVEEMLKEDKTIALGNHNR